MHILENNRQKKRGQHYIPQLYLKHFSKGRKKEYYIWSYEIKTSKVFESKISKVCKENWFYDRHNIFENALSILEGQFSKIYRIIKSNPICTLIKQEKKSIAEFIYNIHARTRKAREAILNINKKMQHDKNFRRRFQYVFPGHNIEDELEELKRTFQISNIFGTKIPSYSYNPKMDETIEKLMNYDYYLFRNNTKNEFYTSDHPISQFDTSEKKGIKVAMPLTSDLFFVM